MIAQVKEADRGMIDSLSSRIIGFLKKEGINARTAVRYRMPA